MKYCKKCGTLLEDTQMTCIGCGSDVSSEENYSLYPPEMEESIKEEKTASKKRSGLIFIIIGIVVLLIALIGVLIWYVSSYQIDSLAEAATAAMEESVADDGSYSDEEEYVDEETEDYEDASEEEEFEDASEEEESEDESNEAGGLTSGLEIPDAITPTVDNSSESSEPAENKSVKIEKGDFYNTATVKDGTGTVIFTTMYPEDFTNESSGVEYDKYSLRYPESFSFAVSDDKNIVQFTYMSAQHFWYRKSSKGKSRSNERDIFKYMTYYTYDGVKPYLEALINASYKDIKKLEFIEKKPIDEAMEGKLKSFSEELTKNLSSGDIGDYASIGSDTVYMPMKGDYEACIYSYKATSKQGNFIYMDFYIPVVATTLNYSSAAENDQGDVIEWVVPCIAAFEAGNEELHNAYKDAFKTFIYNSKPTKEFFYVNYAYGQYLDGCIKGDEKPSGLTSAKLKEYHESFNNGSDIGKYNQGIYDFLYSYGSTCSTFAKKDGSEKFALPGQYKVGYLDPEKNKFFASVAEDEYPGETYEAMDASVGTPDADYSEDSSPAAEEAAGVGP